jgi:ribonuclease R
VQITELQIDGLVHVTSLANDYYHFESGTQRLVGERTGKAYSLGDAMRVRVHKVDLDARKIDFRPVVADQDKVADKGKKRKGRR